jgi:hypothetical protein
MAWSEKIYPNFRADSEKERAVLRRMLAMGRIHEYLGLDGCPGRMRWVELRRFYHRLTLVLEYYQGIPPGPERRALGPVLAEAMLHLSDCRAVMSDKQAGPAAELEEILALMGASFLPPY